MLIDQAGAESEELLFLPHAVWSLGTFTGRSILAEHVSYLEGRSSHSVDTLEDAVASTEDISLRLLQVSAKIVGDNLLKLNGLGTQDRAQPCSESPTPGGAERRSGGQ
jgi:hypothetical protein